MSEQPKPEPPVEEKKLDINNPPAGVESVRKFDPENTYYYLKFIRGQLEIKTDCHGRDLIAVVAYINKAFPLEVKSNLSRKVKPASSASNTLAQIWAKAGKFTSIDDWWAQNGKYHLPDGAVDGHLLDEEQKGQIAMAHYGKHQMPAFGKKCRYCKCD